MYSDSYYFLTPEQRKHNHNFRAHSEIIKKHEIHFVESGKATDNFIINANRFIHHSFG